MKQLHIFHPDTNTRSKIVNSRTHPHYQVRSSGSQVFVGYRNHRAEPVAVLRRAPTSRMSSANNVLAQEPSLSVRALAAEREGETPGKLRIRPSQVHPAVTWKARHSSPCGQTIGKPANAAFGSTWRQSGCLLG